jgi:hypothetical protein
MENAESHKRKFIDFLENMPGGLTEQEIQKRVTAYFQNKPGLKSYNKNVIWKSSIGRTVFTCSILLCILTILIVTNFFNLHKQNSVSYFDVIAYCAWTVFPPAWLLLEYVWLFPDDAKLDPNQLSDLKYTHELASKVWAGVVVLITVILYIKYGTGNLF